MTKIRRIPIVMVCASLLALTACETGDATPAAAPTTAASAAADMPGTPAGTADGDKDVCKAADKAGKDMTKALVATMMTGSPEPAAIKKLLTDFQASMTAAVANAGDSAVTTAAKATADAAAKAAADADPITAADNPAFEKAGADLTAACKAAGVAVKF